MFLGSNSIIPRLFVIRSDGSGYELMSKKIISSLYPSHSDLNSDNGRFFTSTSPALVTSLVSQSSSEKQKRLSDKTCDPSQISNEILQQIISSSTPSLPMGKLEEKHTSSLSLHNLPSRSLYSRMTKEQVSSLVEKMSYPLPALIGQVCSGFI
jgi:hypothetical protein